MAEEHTGSLQPYTRLHTRYPNNNFPAIDHKLCPTRIPDAWAYERFRGGWVCLCVPAVCLPLILRSNPSSLSAGSTLCRILRRWQMILRESGSGALAICPQGWSRWAHRSPLAHHYLCVACTLRDTSKATCSRPYFTFHSCIQSGYSQQASGAARRVQSIMTICSRKSSLTNGLERLEGTKWSVASRQVAIWFVFRTVIKSAIHQCGPGFNETFKFDSIIPYHSSNSQTLNSGRVHVRLPCSATHVDWQYLTSIE